MHDGHMITTAKHFPGHGPTAIDSHSELPFINQAEYDFDRYDLIPFLEAFNAGVKSVMIGHLEIPAFESKPGLPASMSKSIVTDLLKKKMNFEGLVITDAMNMKAVADSFAQDEAAKFAVLAGNDMILFPSNDTLAIDGIYNAVLSGEISENSIDNSVRKILTAKLWINKFNETQADSTALYKILKNKSHKRLSQELAEKSITLIKDDQNVLPLNPDSVKKITYIALDDTEYRHALKEPMQFELLVDSIFTGAKTYRINRGSKFKEYREALKSARRSKLIIMGTYLNTYTDEDSIYLIDKRQKKFIEDLYKTGNKFIVLNFNNPHLIKEIPFVDTYLCSFSTTDVSQRAMFNAVTGKTDIQGRIPVSIPGTEFNMGFGIEKNAGELIDQGVEEDSMYNFSTVDSLMETAIADSVFPGSVLLVGHRKRIVYNKSFGSYTYDTSASKITGHTLFDLASVSKVIGTTSAAMLLYDRGELNLDSTVATYLPRFNNNGKENVTIKHLLTHNSGLPAFKRYYKFYNYKYEVIYDIMNTGLVFEPGTDYKYSDLGMVTLQMVIEKISGQPLDEFLKSNLFDILGMKNTMYNPPPELRDSCAPTEVDNYWRFTTVQGKVHDENADLLGGVAGHAGLFSTAEDLSKIMFLYINDGRFRNEQIFRKNTIEEWTRRQTIHGDRGFGWGTKSGESYSSCGSGFSQNSFGHTGFTGTSVWVDKERGLFVILLTNRVNPTRENRKIIRFRPLLHDAVIDAVDYH
jgi:CubicO group peptidase (beta-lactamase class C family)/beta-glucosidase-like glycosyl hydrolase